MSTALVDQPTVCGHCLNVLRPDGQSLDFCGEECATAWHRQHADLTSTATPTKAAAPPADPASDPDQAHVEWAVGILYGTESRTCAPYAPTVTQEAM